MTDNNIVNIATKKAMALCSKREYCVSEITEKLKSWNTSDSDAEKIIRILIRENFINEKRYSEAFVKDKFNHNKWGKVKIASHLRVKSIPDELIRQALESVDEDLYKKRMKEIVLEHRKSIKAKNQYDLKGKLLRYGLSKGFESSLLYDLLNDL
ncbi:MAG TPA: regulatory protein RecX [Bacteroidales bacterium]|jgi:regulatory protein|nr:RecX family transcriptional regulator [Bacteroidales bacterium]HPY67186.1 regulatory protein RecX [Bacteroidales bacterium]HQB36214.1 regulatory protein RecX [Bacteroidales bacterium]